VAEEVGRIQRGYLELANILDRSAKMLGSGSEITTSICRTAVKGLA